MEKQPFKRIRDLDLRMVRLGWDRGTDCVTLLQAARWLADSGEFVAVSVERLEWLVSLAEKEETRD